jgi:CheY-like chemotaxis protein
MHALIIEDEGLIAMAIELVLRDCGFATIDVAASQADAIAAAVQRCPDLITCDVRLAPGSGLEAVSTICDSKPIPVIFVTGSVAEARTSFPDHAVLAKPFTDSALRQEVDLAMRITR